MTTPISRGFRGRRREESNAGRVPPGQYVTPDYPVLSAGPTPHQPIDWWSFEIRGEVDEPRSWTWEHDHVDARAPAGVERPHGPSRPRPPRRDRVVAR